MQKLALTSRILYNHDILINKKELNEYRKKHNIPKIIINNEWFDLSYKAQNLLFIKDNNINNLVQNTIISVRKSLEFAYKDNYIKYNLFFEEQLKELKQTLNILDKMRLLFINDGDFEFNNAYEYSWHFINILFRKINWIFCKSCNKYIQSSRGLCNICDIL